MANYKKLPVVIEAVQWLKNWDHPSVRGYRTQHEAFAKCPICSQFYTMHGWIETLEGGHIVCRGDWIITGVQGEHYPCKPDIFEATYEPADDAEDSP